MQQGKKQTSKKDDKNQTAEPTTNSQTVSDKTLQTRETKNNNKNDVPLRR